jgi:hypothetical protein
VCVAFASALGVAVACGGSSPLSSFNPNGGGASGSGGGSGGTTPVLGGGSGGSSGSSSGGAGGCVGVQCQIHSCTGNADGTTISGHIYDPAGNNVLYKVVAYVPATDPDPITDGINSGSCSCDALFSGNPIASDISQPDGSFTIKNAPDGANIPIVIQIGKWRNYFTIPNVTQCAPNNLDTLLPAKLTLPKTATETKFSNIPNIAVSTGGSDSLECILARIGVDESEYTGDVTSTAKHIHIFQGRGGNNTKNPAGPKSPSAGGLWDADGDINKYDIVVLSCEGKETTSPNPTVVADYVNSGGRVFASHYHYAFFYDDQAKAPTTPFPNVADWSLAASGGPNGGDQYNEDVGAIIQTKLANGSAFPEGQALDTWLGNVGALVTSIPKPQGGTITLPSPELDIPDGAGRFDAVVGPTNVSTVWAQSDPNTVGTDSNSSQYFSFDMPFNAPLNDAGLPNYCGRVVYSDLHVGAASNDYGTGDTVPSGCSYPQKLAPDEDAIEFILFDLSSCVTPVTSIPQPPPTGGSPPK